MCRCCGESANVSPRPNQAMQLTASSPRRVRPVADKAEFTLGVSAVGYVCYVPCTEGSRQLILCLVRTMRHVLALGVVIALSAHAFGTAQMPDAICVDGVFHSLYSNPLEQLYERQKRPAFVDSLEGESTANWRGYVACWQIHEGQLYLLAIDTYIRKRRVSVSQLFPRRVRGGRVLADWFTGELRIPDGKQLQYVHMGYGSSFERDIVLTVERGRVVSRRVIDNTKRRLPPERERGEKELKKLDEWEKKKNQQS